MLCYKNGALAREEVRDRFCASSWEIYLQQTFREHTSWKRRVLRVLSSSARDYPTERPRRVFLQGRRAREHDPRLAPCMRDSRQFLSIKKRIISVFPENAPRSRGSSLRRAEDLPTRWSANSLPTSLRWMYILQRRRRPRALAAPGAFRLVASKQKGGRDLRRPEDNRGRKARTGGKTEIGTGQGL